MFRVPGKGLKWLSYCCLFALLGCSSVDEKSETNEKNEQNATFKNKKPNIIVILSDQERYPTHWPADWAEKNLKANARLRQHGLSFKRAYTAACECTPSRAVIYSGEHYPINKVPRTPPEGKGLPSDNELTDIGSVLKNHAGYDVVWKGKWHLSSPLEGGHAWTEKDIANIQTRYDLYKWNPPDAGTAITENIKQSDGTTYNGLKTLGGGWANNDGRYLEGMTPGDDKQTPGFGGSILEYIDSIAKTPPEERKPFCMFISFVNPHDVWVYPKHWKDAGYDKSEFADLGITLPPNYNDDLTTKPSVQLKARNAFNKESPLKNQNEEKEYINFYAYLTKLADSKVNSVLDALDAAGLREDTIIIRTADHGELGLSHGMREKAYTVYEEVTHIPFIVSNPKLYPSAKTTDAFYCHLDLLPTIAELAQVPDFKKFGKGTSVVPVLENPAASVQDSILFTYDDVFFLPDDVPGGHIRALREGDWTYAVYYSENATNFEYEMYNIKDDPGQLKNLLHGTVKPENAAEARRLHVKLKEKIDHAEALPKDFAWPKAPFG
ncbi:MAG: sulfatase-like hydrolase/transferase [Parachlamydiales bacterium]|jgi:arylsulfatase A-like enzyme